MGWLKLTTSETGCCRVDLPCSMVPNRVEAGRCRTNLRQETTNRPAQALDQTLLSSRACMHCFGGALESPTRLEERSGSFNWAMVERQQLPGLSIHSHRVSFRWPGLGCFDPSTPRRMGPKAPPANADPGPGSDPQRGAASCPAGSCCSSAGPVLHNWVIRNPGGLTAEETRAKTGEPPSVSISCR